MERVLEKLQSNPKLGNFFEKSKKILYSKSNTYTIVLLLFAILVGSGVVIFIKRGLPPERQIEAYTLTTRGIRIEAEEMTLNGTVVKDASGSFITFNQ